MAEGGIFSGIGEVIDKIKKPPDLLLFLGIGLFGFGVAKGSFAMTNGMLSWGLICMTAAMAMKLLSDGVSWVSDTRHDYRVIRWWDLIGGSLSAMASLVLVFHQFAGRWLPWHH
ncbi:MAG: hypothetical protein WB341_15135 [Terracidiphilus sp.]